MINFSVKKPYTVLVGVIIVMVLGVMSFVNMTTDLLPSMNFPYVMVMTTYPGASPEEVENIVTKPLEESFKTTENIKGVTSTSSENFSMVMLEFEDGTNMDSAFIELDSKIGVVEGAWTDDMIASPTLMKINPDMMPVMVAAIKSDNLSGVELTDFVNNDIIPKLESTSGVASIETIGMIEEEVTINLNEEELEDRNLTEIVTVDMISDILTAQNFEMPVGNIQDGDESIIVKVGNEFNNIDEIKELEIMPGVALEDITTIEVTDNIDDLYAKINGTDTVILSFQKQSNLSTGETVENLKTSFENLESEFEGVEFVPLMDQGVYIDLIIGSVMQNLIYGAILAVFILLIFLRDLRPTIAIALSIPVSLTFAITLMYFTGVSINIISLSGLALSVGMLVDNAIVVIENIYRLRNEGKDTKEAAIKGATSVAGAIFASTLTTVAVFAPIIFVEGITRQLFQDMALTIAYSLFASLIVALTVIPAMTSNLFKKEKKVENKIFNKIINVYEKLLKGALRFKKSVVVLSLGLFVLSLVLIVNLGLAFMPDMAGDQATVNIEFAEGTTMEEQKQVLDEISEDINSIQDTTHVGSLKTDSNGGSMTTAMMSSGGELGATIYILFDETRTISNLDLENELNEKLNKYTNLEYSISTSNMDMSAMTGSGIQVSIKGHDLDVMQETAKEITALFEGIEGIYEVTSGIDETTMELRVEVDKNKALEYGLTVAQVYSAIAQQISTQVDSTDLMVNIKEYPIVIEKPADDILTVKKLNDFEFEVQDALGRLSTVKLTDIATIVEAQALDSIDREDSSRVLTVSASVNSDANIAFVSRDFDEVYNKYVEENVKEGITLELQGENENIVQALMDILLMVGLAILLIYLIMVAQFQSLRSPFIIMFTIPLAFTGGLIALVITGQVLSVISMVGFLVLTGIVVNNGIVLVDYINQLIEQGKTKQEALIEAGKTRLRPIVMTALTTILGMITLAIGFGMGAEMSQGLGIVVIGGLIYSTILTLFVVPCIYAMFFRKVK